MARAATVERLTLLPTLPLFSILLLTSCRTVPLFRFFAIGYFRTISIRYLFWTVKGAEALATFLLRSNSLLRPLPARPDPP